MHYSLEDGKLFRYRELLRALFADKLVWLRDGTHVRKITEQNGRDSLNMAKTATCLARGSHESKTAQRTSATVK